MGAGLAGSGGVAVRLVERGHELLWQFTGPGRHGVDVVVLGPDGRVVGIEVKGTLRPGQVPRLVIAVSARAIASLDGCAHPPPFREAVVISGQSCQGSIDAASEHLRPSLERGIRAG
jgi:hypothetical protein